MKNGAHLYFRHHVSHGCWLYALHSLYTQREIVHRGSQGFGEGFRKPEGKVKYIMGLVLEFLKLAGVHRSQP